MIDKVSVSEWLQNLNRQGAPVGSRKEGQRAENRLKNRVKHLVPCEYPHDCPSLAAHYVIHIILSLKFKVFV